MESFSKLRRSILRGAAGAPNRFNKVRATRDGRVEPTRRLRGQGKRRLKPSGSGFAVPRRRLARVSRAPRPAEIAALLALHDPEFWSFDPGAVVEQVGHA